MVCTLLFMHEPATKFPSAVYVLQVVHSRTLALPDGSPLGGRLYLVPFLDMLNHAGRQTSFLLGDASAAQDNVRCSLPPPTLG